ncbi:MULTISPECIES: hypothetical protein [unclassified Mycoplasma]|uniref:hypothetical protein n=1 Tax=unclassified Mycoplasma TaxID=2683645 RepID=UPI00211C02CE|nr:MULTISPECIES: hypothetical protein [unclassified Mycoplasma]UUM19796.1 hypothetical protein NPA11_03470 [Mycoplasma sp. 1578d]UUM24780.1 hypothetical protein NPA12_03745 [Mycoplasma sp. 3686d]
MVDKVKAYCKKCDQYFEFYFGLARELEKITWFLNSIIKTQKNLLDLNVFIKTFQEEVSVSNKFFGTNTDLVKEHQEIIDFFSDEEKRLLKVHPLISFDLSVYPVVFEAQLEQEKRNVFHLAMLGMHFIGKKQYYRTYPGVLYIQFNQEQNMFTCPNHLELIAERVNE